MSDFIPVNTPGGMIWAEIEQTKQQAGLELTAAKREKVFKNFEETAEALKQNAQYLLNILKELSPEEVQVSCGIKVGAEGGNTFFGLAKASSEASYTVTIKWKAN